MLLFLLCAFHARGQFITVWKTNNAGSSGSTQILIPAGGTNYSIAWEEVGVPSNKGTTTGSGSYTLNLPSAGTYQVSITPGSGTFTRFFFNGATDQDKLLEVRQWGNIQWESMERMFAQCDRLQITATDVPDLSNVTSMEFMFGSCGALSTVPGINNWDVSSVTNMRSLFAQATLFNDALDNWNVGNVTDMSGMFQNTAFNQPIGNWNVGNVTDMSGMFQSAYYFNQPIASWDVSKVVTMYGMFNAAASFNQPLNDWNVSQVTGMGDMFSSANLFNQPLDNWEVGNVQNMGSMFAYTFSFNQPIGSWDVGNVTYMQSMFREAAAFNQPLDAWDVGNVKYMQSMFQDAPVFNQPINNWVTSKVTDMSSMFDAASSFNQPLNNWDLSQATIIAGMFRNAVAFNQPVNQWNVSGVTNLFRAFYNASAFNQSLGNWTISPGAGMTGLLVGSGMDCANMSRTLEGWADNTATPNSITFGAQGITYGSPGAAALEILRNTKNWSIDIGNEVLCEALDVSLINFNAKSADGTVKLEWATASETDNDYFDIQRSANARSWEAIGRAEGAGTLKSISYYSSTDASPLEGTSYYRLKIVDLAGKADYSNITAVSIKIGSAVSIYPNPATTSLTVSGMVNGTVVIYNLSGQKVLQTRVTSEKTGISVSELPIGSYLIKSEDGEKFKFIKN